MLDLVDVEKTVGHGSGQVALLNGIRLTVTEGDFLSVVGPYAARGNRMVSLLDGRLVC